ncbi:hypothetical protein ACQQ9V_03000 [Hornefia butyriciproducens]
MKKKTHHKTVCLISCIQCQIEGTKKMNTHKSKGSPQGVPEKINILPVYDTKHNPEPRKKSGKSAVKGVPEKINYYTPVPIKPREKEPGEITMTISPIKWWRAYKAGKEEAKRLTIDEIREKYHLIDLGGPFSARSIADIKKDGTYNARLMYYTFAWPDLFIAYPWIKLKKHPRAYKIVKYSAVGALVGISFISIALVVGIIFCIFFLLYIAKL